MPESLEIIGVGCSWNNTVIWTKKDIYITGDNKYGQLGIGTSDQFRADFQKLNLPDASSIDQVHCLSESFIAISTNSQGKKEVYTWGWNEHGNLATGDKEDRSIPTRIEAGLTPASTVSPGGAYFFI